MVKVIGVRFRTAGKIYFFSSRDSLILSKAINVIVETARGVEYRASCKRSKRSCRKKR